MIINYAENYTVPNKLAAECKVEIDTDYGKMTISNNTAGVKKGR